MERILVGLAFRALAQTLEMKFTRRRQLTTDQQEQRQRGQWAKAVSRKAAG